jgi:hypothetical protein
VELLNLTFENALAGSRDSNVKFAPPGGFATEIQKLGAPSGLMWPSQDAQANATETA